LAKLLHRIKGLGNAVFRLSNIPVAIAFVVIVAVTSIADHLNRSVQVERLRGEVLARASVIRAKLEGNINGNLQLVRGLVAMIETQPDMTQERFSALAGRLVEDGSPIRNIAAAPDLVVSMIYPVEPNRAAIGLDYNRNPMQREAAMRARDTGELILAGPVDLVQGGRGFIGRFPVFTDAADGGRAFWGLVSVVIDLERLYLDSGLLDDTLGLDIAITGRDALGAAGERFYGSGRIAGSDPVLVDVMLPSGSWQIAAVPRQGWIAPPDRINFVRLLMVIAGAMILVPMFITGRLIDERQRYIGALRNRETELEALSRRLQLALETSRVGVWEMRLGDDTEIWDERTNELFGYPADGGQRDFSHWKARVHPDDYERASAEFSAAVEERRSYASEYRLLLHGGEVRYVRSLGTLFENPGEPPRMLGINWDVSADVARNEDLRHANMLSEARNAELEATKARIEYNALHDSLTGLPNRRYLDEVLAEHGEKFASGERAALLHIDLDRFKQINDTLGHAAGDAMLVHAARLLREVTGERDFVARVGGDEFVVVVLREGSAEEVRGDYPAMLAETIVERMREPVMFQGHECRFGVSVGIARDTDTIADPKRLLINADMALYRAKNRGRNRYQFFNDALQAEIVTTKRIADEILSGLEHNQFVPYYQPQFSADTHDIIGVEALARWNHPTEGLLTPAAFIRIADELNVVASIDRLILEQTLRDLHAWQADGIAIPKASVNVSARRLQDEELVTSLGTLDIRPGTISFELVESIFLDEQDELIAWNVDRIKEFGIDVEIDDFGTGYASIVSLMKLKPRRLKIDRQLIMPIVNSEAQRQLVGSIIDIGKSLGIEVLAEGVETLEHAKILRKLGCDALQGYAFAQAMSAAELADFVLTRRWRAAS
jgi:diguanylate cyclase (GGDEF)-like protein